MSIQEIPNVTDALNDYFKLKNIFEIQVNKEKTKLINNLLLSNREKRAEFLKIMPKCVNCKRPSKKGTIFSIKYIPETDDKHAYKKLTAMCGNLADPCNLDIEIHLNETEPLDKLISNVRSEIKTYKNKIINDKNRLLFGLITTEKALENFDFNKSYINDLTSLYEMYLDQWNKIIDNPEKKLELDESLVLSYQNIDKIKACIKKMNETDDSQFAVDAADIYVTTLKPLLDKIRHLKYSENIVYRDNDTCNLIQRTYTEVDLGVSAQQNKVIKYNVGLQAKKVKKKKPGLFIIESDEEDQSIPNESLQDNKIKIQIQKPAVESSSTGGMQPDEPIIGQGQDGIEWHNEEYKSLWSKLPKKLKDEFKLNIEWMKSFMNKCVNARVTEGTQFHGCSLPTPDNIIIPPRETSNGQYDFGISIYNIIFNRQPRLLQEKYLTLYKEDPITKVKNYKSLEDEMNRLVEHELDMWKINY